MWSHFEHGADIGIRGEGPSAAEAFAEAAMALTAVVTEPGSVTASNKVQINCSASSMELLLVEWLSALVYEMAVRKMVFGRYEVCLSGLSLSASMWGEALSSGKHQPVVEVKGVTYTALGVGEDDNGIWTAQCVVDV